jgi:hypothetical protein
VIAAHVACCNLHACSKSARACNLHMGSCISTFFLLRSCHCCNLHSCTSCSTRIMLFPAHGVPHFDIFSSSESFLPFDFCEQCEICLVWRAGGVIRNGGWQREQHRRGAQRRAHLHNAVPRVFLQVEPGAGGHGVRVSADHHHGALHAAGGNSTSLYYSQNCIVKRAEP